MTDRMNTVSGDAALETPPSQTNADKQVQTALVVDGVALGTVPSERAERRRWPEVVLDLCTIAMSAAGVALTVYRNTPQPERWLWTVGAGVVGGLLGLGARALRIRRYGS